MKILRHPGFLLFGFLVAVGFNLPHLVAVHPVSTLPSWYIWSMFIVLDFGILLLAVWHDEDSDWTIQQTDSAQVFAWIVFILNLYYYWTPLQVSWTIPAIIALGPGLFLSSIPAFFVYFFSKKIAQSITTIDQQSEIDNYESQIALHKTQIEKHKSDIASYKAEIDKLRPAHRALRSLTESVTTLNRNQKLTFCQNGHPIIFGNATLNPTCQICANGKP